MSLRLQAVFSNQLSVAMATIAAAAAAAAALTWHRAAGKLSIR